MDDSKKQIGENNLADLFFVSWRYLRPATYQFSSSMSISIGPVASGATTPG